MSIPTTPIAPARTGMRAGVGGGLPQAFLSRHSPYLISVASTAKKSDDTHVFSISVLSDSFGAVNSLLVLNSSRGMLYTVR